MFQLGSTYMQSNDLYHVQISVKLSMSLLHATSKSSATEHNNMWHFHVCTDEITSLLKPHNSDYTNNIHSRKLIILAIHSKCDQNRYHMNVPILMLCTDALVVKIPVRV